jgi:mono/diheme cytochrome c family protein/DNA-binding beta-propeller fold protein YncE
MQRRMIHSPQRPPACWLLLTLGSATLAASAADAPVSFSKEIAPILIAKCVACHGPEKTKGGFQLHTFESLRKGGESKAPSITPGQAKESKLFELITAKDPDDRMPQKDDPLPAAQIALIERWISEGASFDGLDRKAALATLVPQVAHPEPPAAYQRPVPVLALAFSPDGKELAASGYHEVTIWNPQNGALLRRIKNIPQQTLALGYSADGKLLAVAGGAPGRSGEVKLVDPANGKEVRTLITTTDAMLALVFAPDGQRLAAGGADNSIRIFNIATGKEELRVEQHADWVMGLTFSPDGSQLASASRDKSARLLDARTGELEQTYVGHGEPVFGVAFSRDGKLVFSAGRDRKIHLWQVSDAKKIHELAGFEGDVLKLLVQEDQLFSISSDKQVRRFAIDGKKTEVTKSFSGHKDVLYALALHEPTKRLATGSYDGEVRVWNAETGELVTAFVAAPGFRGAQTAAK